MERRGSASRAEKVNKGGEIEKGATVAKKGEEDRNTDDVRKVLNGSVKQRKEREGQVAK